MLGVREAWRVLAPGGHAIFVDGACGVRELDQGELGRRRASETGAMAETDAVMVARGDLGAIVPPLDDMQAMDHRPRQAAVDSRVEIDPAVPAKVELLGPDTDAGAP